MDIIVNRLDKIPERDRQTDRGTARGYYSGLHCEQCGRAVEKHTTTLQIN